MPLNQAPIQQQIYNNFGSMTPPWVLWFQGLQSSLAFVRRDGSLEMKTIADADALNNSLYFSSDQNKLVYKDGAGVVNDLY